MGIFYDAFSQDMFMATFHSTAIHPARLFRIVPRRHPIDSAGLFGGARSHMPCTAAAADDGQVWHRPKYSLPYMETTTSTSSRNFLVTLFANRLRRIASHKLFRFRDLNSPAMPASRVRFGDHRTVPVRRPLSCRGNFTDVEFITIPGEFSQLQLQSLQTSFRVNGWHGLTTL